MTHSTPSHPISPHGPTSPLTHLPHTLSPSHPLTLSPSHPPTSHHSPHPSRPPDKNYGTVLIPEGLIESIPELKLLISEIDQAFAEAGCTLGAADVRSKLTLWSRALLDSLPDFMQYSLLLSRGSDNQIQVSQTETERLLAHFVDIELGYRKKKGTYKGSFSVVCSFIGYQTRGASPSNFDINFAYNLGYTATKLVLGGFSGYMVTIGNLKSAIDAWQVGGCDCDCGCGCGCGCDCD